MSRPWGEGIFVNDGAEKFRGWFGRIGRVFRKSGGWVSLGFYENAEPSGYRETWSVGETVTGGTVNEDATPGVTGWGQECIEFGVTTGPAFVRDTIAAATTPFYLACELQISAESFANNQFCRLISLLHDATNTILLVYAAQIAGALELRADVYHNGSPNTVVLLTPFSLSTRYRFEFKWDVTADTWQVWLDDTSKGSGSITSTPATAPWEVTDIVVGAIATDNTACTFQVGRFVWSRDRRVGEAPLRLSGAGGCDRRSPVGAGMVA